MDPPPPPSGGGAAYSCVARGTRILQSHNPSRDSDLDAVAALCLEDAPLYHSRYSHTDSSRTYAFLFEDGYTYFAIVDAGADAIPLLQTVRDGFKKGALRNGVHDELTPVIRSLRSSMESMSRPSADDGDQPPPPAVSLQKSLSGMKSRGRRMWWRYVKIVVAADLILCLVLFGVWMAICRGFQCVSGSG